MPAFVHGADKGSAANFGGAGPAGMAFGVKVVTVFGSNAARGLHSHLAETPKSRPASCWPKS